MATLALALLLLSPSTSEAPNLTLHAEVIRYVSVTQADLDLARAVATSLLQSARIAMDWRDCDARVAACDVRSNGAASIDVRLIPTSRAGHDHECGAIVPDPHRSLPVVLVYLPAVDEKLRKFHFGPHGRSNPLISTLSRGHLIGAVIAHEIGHALGLPHETRGVMKPDLDADDMVALRQSRLTFLASERPRLQEALAAAARRQQATIERRGQ